MKEKFSKFYLISKVSTSTARKYHHSRQYKIPVFLQDHQEHSPMSFVFHTFNFLFNQSAISLIFALSTFAFMYSHRKKSNSVKSTERAAQEIEPPLPIYLPLKFSLNYVRTLKKWGGAPSCCQIFLLLSVFLCII